MIPRPEWNLFCVYDDYDEEYDGNFAISALKQLRFEIKLPLLVTGKKIDVQVR